MKKQSTKTPGKKVSVQTKKSSVTDYRITTPMDHLKTSVLVVSLLGNAFILIGWLAISLTTQFDDQVASFLFTR